jgi:hypothetical protein
MCTGLAFPKWQAQAIQRLIERGDAEPALLIVRRDDETAPKPSGTLARLTKPKALWRLYRAKNEPSALRPVDMSEELDRVPQISCAPIRKGKFSEYFSSYDVARIKEHDLDFILRFAFGIIRGEVLESARHGVWSFHHGDEEKYRGGPPGFWEMYDGEPVTGALLQRLTDKLDAGIVLRRGYFKTCDYSYSRNIDHLYLGSTEWPASLASEIAYVGDSAVAAPPSTSKAPIRVAPTNLQMMRFGARLAKNIARRIVERSQREEWNVGITPLSPARVLRGEIPKNVSWYPTPSDGWMADPMARVSDNGTVHVLCERMELATNKGYIASVSFDGTSWEGERVAIAPGCHASYPYLFSHGSDVYCVPETYEAGEVQLFRSVQFPQGWERVGTLVDGISVVDSTVFEFEDRWWLLCTAAEASGERLLAFHAEHPQGPWIAHAANPIKIDVRSSRPAGPPFWHDGALYRPAQDCSRTYGGRIAINKILELSPTAFEEETVAHLEPDPHGPYNKGLHTVSFVGDRCVIDGKRYRWRGLKRS